MTFSGSNRVSLGVSALAFCLLLVALFALSFGLSAAQDEGKQPFDPSVFKKDQLREQLKGRAVISIWRTGGGWGSGLRYSIKLYSDGELILRGLSNAAQSDKEPTQSLSVDRTMFDIVEREVLRLKDDHCDKYMITDQGTIYYRILNGEEDIKFSVYTGCLSVFDEGQRLSCVIKDALGISVPDNW